MEAFAPTSTFLGSKPLFSRSHAVKSRCSVRQPIVCAKRKPGPQPSPNNPAGAPPTPKNKPVDNPSSFAGMVAGPGSSAKPEDSNGVPPKLLNKPVMNKPTSTEKESGSGAPPKQENSTEKPSIPQTKPASKTSSFTGMAAGPGAPAKSSGLPSISKNKTSSKTSSFTGMAAGPGTPAKSASIGSINKEAPKQEESAEQTSTDEASTEEAPPKLRVVRALGQKKSRPPPSIPKKTASDFIAEGVVDDVDEDETKFIEEDIRFGIDNVIDPFSRDADEDEEREQQVQAAKDLADVGKLLDVTGDGGVMKKLVTPGTGDVVDKGAKVTVEYTGKLDDGTTFDSSRPRDDSFSFELGAGAVIKGWESGVATMRSGEVAEFTISPEYAYGRRGMPPVIPGSATLTFEIELLKVMGGEKNEIKKMEEYNPDVARTPQDIAREYDALLETQEERKKNMSLLDRFYIISPFASQTGERPPWWLNPSITFVGVFALCGIAFYLVILAGGVHIGYVDGPVDVNIFK